MIKCETRKNGEKFEKGSAVLSVLIVLIIAVIILSWILTSVSSKSENGEDLKKLVAQIRSNEDGKWVKKGVPSVCSSSEKIMNYTEHTVKELYGSHRDYFVKAEARMALLDRVCDAFHKTSRFIVHWMLMGSKLGDHTEGDWIYVHSCERHRSTYTVSSGPSGCYKNGGVKIMETGVHAVYAKLTFVCTEADNLHKTIWMEVIVHKGGNDHTILLRDTQSATCEMKSDLLTIFRSGMFTLKKGNVIHVRYKVPHNVKLPTTPYQGFKSNMGVWRVGFE